MASSGERMSGRVKVVIPYWIVHVIALSAWLVYLSWRSQFNEAGTSAVQLRTELTLLIIRVSAR